MSASNSIGQTVLSLVGLHIINHARRYATYEYDGRICINHLPSQHGEYVKLIDVINLLKENADEVTQK